MFPPVLSSDESKVLHNGQFFITKAAVDEKIDAIFMQLKTEIETLSAAAPHFPPSLLTTSGRVHRGEHLGPFPWRAMDCPRHFAGQDMFAFRTLLVWGSMEKVLLLDSITYHLTIGLSAVERWI